jgi:hypothetical protein
LDYVASIIRQALLRRLLLPPPASSMRAHRRCPPRSRRYCAARRGGPPPPPPRAPRRRWSRGGTRGSGRAAPRTRAWRRPPRSRVNDINSDETTLKGRRTELGPRVPSCSYRGLATASRVTIVGMSIHPEGTSCTALRSSRCSQQPPPASRTTTAPSPFTCICSIHLTYAAQTAAGTRRKKATSSVRYCVRAAQSAAERS